MMTPLALLTARMEGWSHDDKIIIGQYSGKMLAETGSFDILFGNRVLGIGFFSSDIHKYKYI